MNLIGYSNSEDIWIPDPVQKSKVEQANEYNVDKLKIYFKEKYDLRKSSFHENL